MNKIEKKLLELFRDEALQRIRLTDQNDVLADEVDHLNADNDDLEQEISYLKFENRRLEKHIEALSERIENLKKIKMGDATDEIIKSCGVPSILKRKITAENSD